MKKLFMSSFLMIFIYFNVNAQVKINSNGYVAVGSTTATPYYLLDLINGDINTRSDMGYRINGAYVLRNNSNPDDIFVGVDAGNSTMTGHFHTFVGKQAGATNTTGQYNSFIGYGTGFTNNTGSSNTALGTLSMYANTTGSRNTFVGTLSGYNNTSGNYNTMMGAYAGSTNTTGYQNSYLGYYAGQGNTSGYNNSCLGFYAGQNNTTGYYNTNIGMYAGQNNTTGVNNTYLGANAKPNNSNYSNSTGIGNSAVVTASNQIRIGNGTITSIGGQVGWTTLSDGRFKTNIQENVKGLAFINKLRPITYQLNTHQFDDFIIQDLPDSIKTMHQQNLDFAPSSAIVHSGFIAQEVDSVANICGFVSSIVHTPANNTDIYALSYAEMVVPLVKAVQELSKKVDTLQFINTLQQKQITQMQIDLAACCSKPINTTKIGENSTGGQEFSEQIISIDLIKADQIILYQNEPISFNSSTVIRYFIPENMQIETYMAFYDSYGNEIKKVEVKETGVGKIEVSTQNLAAGIYSYSLIVNKKVVATKKMINNK